ncbi:MAG TPA: Rrf2 family transcriptional regulator, partial [Candidatus Syntrophosphaera thermopropionivorans]|nr:Rrf2 family transcriptional regulator [Candidatus Syntrophosphaera thermopropionivorans]
MPVSTKTEYALRALVEIAEHPEGTISAQNICNQQQLPKKYIEHLLSSLKNAGLIISSAGLKGGYVLAQSPDAITLYDVMKAVDDHRL